MAHATIKGAAIPPEVSPVDDIASLGVGATLGNKVVTVLAFDPSIMAKAATNAATPAGKVGVAGTTTGTGGLIQGGAVI